MPRQNSGDYSASRRNGRPRLSCPTRAATAQSMRLFRGRMALRLWCGLARRLALLHLFLLSGMFLLDLLRLLSVALFHLLFLSVVVVFRGGLVMFFLLLLLELLVILRLLGSQLVLLLLIFLVRCSVAGVWRRELVRLQFAGVIVGSGTSFIF